MSLLLHEFKTQLFKDNEVVFVLTVSVYWFISMKNHAAVDDNMFTLLHKKK